MLSIYRLNFLKMWVTHNYNRKNVPREKVEVYQMALLCLNNVIIAILRRFIGAPNKMEKNNKHY